MNSKDIWLKKNMRKGKEVRINIPRKQILKLCVHLTLLGIPRKLRYEMTFEMETWSIRSRDYD